MCWLGREGRLPARLTAAKATPERAWLGEVSAVMPRQALAGLDTAYRNSFASVVGRRKGPKAGRARFRSCKAAGRPSGSPPAARFKVLISGGSCACPRSPDVPVRWSRPLPPEPSGSR